MLDTLGEHLRVLFFQLVLNHVDFFTSQKASDDRDPLSKHEPRFPALAASDKGSKSKALELLECSGDLNRPGF